MMNKTPNTNSRDERQDSQLSQTNESQTKDRRSVFKELPGTSEGKAALLEFELADLSFVEEQQTFDFGAEFSDAKPTAEMLDKSDLPPNYRAISLDSQIMDGISPSLSAEETDDVYLGDDDAQLDFEEAAKAIALEEAARSLKAEKEEAEAGRATTGREAFSAVSLPQLQIESDSELMQAITAIPKQMAFKIGDVAEIVGVKQYVLRYWETEFDALKPRKSKNGQRVYTRRDVETAMMIKKLLYKDRFSIEGARTALRQLKGKVREDKQWGTLLSSHESVRDGLRSLVGEIRRFRDALN